MADVFISYKQEDRSRVEPLVKCLKSNGFEVWWDLELLPGEKIGLAIQQILKKVSCVIVVWSKRSLKSNWVPDEATFGRDHNMLIPITIDGSEPPLGFRQLLTLDLENWGGDAEDPLLQKVFRAVREQLRRPKRQRPRSTIADAEIADSAISQLILSNQKRKDEQLEQINWVKPYLYPHL
jgi:hypothetical protein